MTHTEHHSGETLRPTRKFKFRQATVPMRKPRRGKKHHGRKGGLRGKGSKRG